MWLSNSKGKQIAVPFLRNVYAKGKLIIAIAIEVGHENDKVLRIMLFNVFERQGK